MTNSMQLLPPAPTARKPQLSASSPQQPCRILCVDDDSMGLEFLGQILAAEGYAVVLSNRPVAALRTNLTRIDLAIVDFDMPGLNGRELLLLLRGLRATFPIILLSASAHSLPQPTRALFSRCIDKATPAHHVLDVVAHLLATRQAPGQLT